MLRFVYEWLVVPPAKLLAELLGLVLSGLVPLAAGVATGAGAYFLCNDVPRASGAGRAAKTRGPGIPAAP